MKKAFTLAEVLITLGIIGVVAAITMPVLIQNHRKSVVGTKLSKFYSIMNQAISLAEVEYGDRENWHYTVLTNITPEQWYKKYLNEYIKNVKFEINDDGVLVYLGDGSVFTSGDMVHYVFYPDVKSYEYCKENLSECSLGVNNFLFYYNPALPKIADSRKYISRLLEPYKYGWDGRESTLSGETPSLVSGCGAGCGCYTAEGSHLFCTALIQLHGWKIPKNYPYRF